MGVGGSLIAAFSIICLIGAALIALGSINLLIEESHVSEMAYGAVLLGLCLAFASQFIPFPVGCYLDAWPYNLTNVHHGCPAGPDGVWSTIWPNVLTACVGVVLATWGYGKTRSRNARLPGLGLGLMISGFVLLVMGLSVGYTTMCPANGCAPLTASQWWSLFWPDVIVDMLGTGLMVAGLVILIASRRMKDTRLIQSETQQAVPRGPGSTDMSSANSPNCTLMAEQSPF